jgi:hypothetical protein
MHEHDELQSLLPWYANGTLAEHEMNRFESHLKSCARCRAELDNTLNQIRTLRLSTPPAHTTLMKARSANFSRLQSRITPSTPRHRRMLVPVAASAAVAALIAVIFTLVVPQPEPFKPMTTPTSTRFETVVQIIFDPQTTEQDIRFLLIDSGATLLGGPTPKGVYRLGFNDLTDATAYVSRLRAHPIIRWAELERRE